MTIKRLHFDDFFSAVENQSKNTSFDAKKNNFSDVKQLRYLQVIFCHVIGDILRRIWPSKRLLERFVYILFTFWNHFKRFSLILRTCWTWLLTLTERRLEIGSAPRKQASSRQQKMKATFPTRTSGFEDT